MTRKKTLLRLALALPLCLVVYEAAAVIRARSMTQDVLAAVSQRELSLSSLPQRWIDMMLAVEDPGFWEHSGIDLHTPGQGLTTLTQSLAKFLYFDKFTPGIAKLELMLIARFALHPAMSKRDQLETFVNYARFGTVGGKEVRGFSAAARTYHGRELHLLNDHEFLSLVAMLIAPSRMDPRRHPADNERRTRRIEAYIAGRCQPAGLTDVYYERCDL